MSQNTEAVFLQKVLFKISMDEDCHYVSSTLIASSSMEFDSETMTRHQ
jgi:hypothetical protein